MKLDDIKGLEMLGRNERAALFTEVWDKLEQNDLQEMLLDVWVSCEWPGQVMDYDAWLDVFMVAGYVSDDDTPKPKEPITIYRSCDPLYKWGLSWTQDFKVARWFNERNQSLGFKTKIYEATIDPKFILGIFNGRNEKEVVVHYHMLSNVKEVIT